jgi:uncharacterized membrane protein YqiK
VEAQHDQRRWSGAGRGGAELGREGAALRDQGPDAAGRHPAQHAGPDHRRTREARADRRVRRPRQEQINIATGEREAFIARSEGEKQAEINKALGEAAAITAVADATADAIRKIADAIQQPGGEQAVQLKVAEKAVDAYGNWRRRTTP